MPVLKKLKLIQNEVKDLDSVPPLAMPEQSSATDIWHRDKWQQEQKGVLIQGDVEKGQRRPKASHKCIV